MRLRLSVLLVVLAHLVLVAAARADAISDAARHFERGEQLYEEGRYEQAVQEFLQANQITPHWATLFNIARCHESLGALDRALEFYGKALQAAPDEARRAEVQRHLDRIARRPVGVLVATTPPGARITVDGRKQAEPRPTPTLVELTPGEHVLLLRREGHQLDAVRVEVRVGQRQSIQRELRALPARPPAAAPKCPTCPTCPRPTRLVDARRLHVHLHLLSALAFTDDEQLTAGPGIQLHVSYRRLVFGGNFLAFIVGQQEVPEFTLDGKIYDRQSFRRWILEGQGGYIFPWRGAYFYATGSLGLMVDRAVFAGAVDDYVREKFAFVWGLGGGLEIHATRWLSFGAALRFCMAHGDRVDREDERAEADDTHHFPFGIF